MTTKKPNAMPKIDADSPEAKSADLVAENIARLKALFPELVTEGKNGASVNVDVLKQLVGDQTVTDADEKYGLNWFGKRRARQLALTPSLGTLRPAPEESVDWDTTKNLMIEGDNLEVLKLLQKSYAGKVKLIYIDPPYNTGDDFVYKDDLHQILYAYELQTGLRDSSGQKVSSLANTKSGGNFHTNWLNMIYPRIKLARELLTNDGAIIVSIDDNESAQLRKLLDEVFGEENFVNELTWIANITGRQISGYGAAKTYERIFIYAKNVESFETLTIDVEFAKSQMPDAYKGFHRILEKDEIGEYSIGDTLYNHNRIFNEQTRPNLVFSIFFNPETGDIKTGNIGSIIEGYTEIKPHPNNDGTHKYHAWRWSRQKVEAEKFDLSISPKRNGYEIRTKIRDFSKTTLKDVITNISNGLKETNDLFDGRRIFDYPKSVSLIKIFLMSMNSKSSLIMDFFAGSGTTGHAVMSQNAFDKEARRYILVQLPELLDADNRDQKVAAFFCDSLQKPRTIAELTKERLRRAGAKIKAENPKWKGDTGFRVFKLDSSNIRTWDPNRDDLDKTLLDHVEHLKEGRSEHDLLYELLLKLGLDLCVPIEERKGHVLDSRLRGNDGLVVHSVGGGVLMACLAPRIERDEVEPVAEGIVAWYKELAPAGETTCVFRDSAFADDVAKTNMAAILEQNGITTVRSL